MKIRKTVFWTHLIAGLVSAIVVVMLSVTGVILTYDRQIKDWANHEYYDIADTGKARVTVDELLLGARNAGIDAATVIMRSDHDRLPMAAKSRRETVYMNPYSAEVLGAGNVSVSSFFSTVTGWHRWFDLSGESRATGKAIVDAANLIFLFLIVTGIYLWLPPLYRWAIIRPRLAFNDRAKSAKARDYNWHHVFGFWSLIPLFFIVVSGLTLSYAWADKVVYFLAGEEAPAQSGPAPPGGEGGGREVSFDPDTALSLQQHFEFAAAQSPDWKRIDVHVPKPASPTINVAIDTGTGGEPLKKRTLVLHRNSGEIIRIESFADRTPAGKVLGYFRWLHTGEALGIIGQTIAGLVTALSLLMVWTGAALAYRRLVQPVVRRRQQN